MSATIAAPRANHADVDPTEASTREQILRLVVADGPITAAELAERLELTSAGIRRHVGALESADQIAVHRVPGAHRGRGRPARHYVATESGHRALANAYSALAVDVLRYLENVVGPDAVNGFAEARGQRLEAQYLAAVAGAGSDPSARIEALAGAMTADGYAATARPVPGGHAIQLCQGHCRSSRVRRSSRSSARPRRARSRDSSASTCSGCPPSPPAGTSAPRTFRRPRPS